MFWSPMECADMSALWFEATCRLVESGVVPPHSYERLVKLGSADFGFCCSSGRAQRSEARAGAIAVGLTVVRALPNWVNDSVTLQGQDWIVLATPTNPKFYALCECHSSATPLSESQGTVEYVYAISTKSAVAAPLCRRSPKPFGAFASPSNRGHSLN